MIIIHVDEGEELFTTAERIHRNTDGSLDAEVKDENGIKSWLHFDRDEVKSVLN